MKMTVDEIKNTVKSQIYDIKDTDNVRVHVTYGITTRSVDHLRIEKCHSGTKIVVIYVNADPNVIEAVDGLIKDLTHD